MRNDHDVAIKAEHSFSEFHQYVYDVVTLKPVNLMHRHGDTKLHSLSEFDQYVYDVVTLKTVN